MFDPHVKHRLLMQCFHRNYTCVQKFNSVRKHEQFTLSCCLSVFYEQPIRLRKREASNLDFGWCELLFCLHLDCRFKQDMKKRMRHPKQTRGKTFPVPTWIIEFSLKREFQYKIIPLMGCATQFENHWCHLFEWEWVYS